MRTILSLAVVLAVGFSTVADDSSKNEAKRKSIDKALEGFVGTWEISHTQPEGATREARKLVFRKDMTYAALDKDGNELWAGTYDLDPTAEPKVWDHRSNESKKTGGDVLGIYELDGDKLKFACVVGTWNDQQWTGKRRPTEYKLPSADVVLELRRVMASK